MTTESKFTGMVIVNDEKSFKDDVMTVLEMEALLWSGEEYSVRMQQTEEVQV